MSINPYAETADRYLQAGFSPLPLPYGKKLAPPEGWTGAAGQWAGPEDVKRWAGLGRRNVCIRLPDGVIGIDVDAYGSKPGGETLRALEAELGALPETWRSSSRVDDPVSGIRFYRVPEGLEWRDAGPGVEIIRHGHRYVVVAPSKHPDGRTYCWRAPGGSEWNGVSPGGVDDLAQLPEAWVQRLRKPERVAPEGAGEAGAGGGGARSPYATRAIEGELTRLDDLDLLGWGGPAWDNTCFEVACNLVEFGNSDWSGWDLEELRELFLERCPADEDFGAAEHEAKWASALRTVDGAGRTDPNGLGDWKVAGTEAAEKAAQAAADHYDPWDISGDSNLGQRLAHDYLAGHFLAWGKGRWAQWDGRRWDLDVPEDVVVGRARNALLDILVFELGKASARRDGVIRAAGNDRKTVDLAMESHDARVRSLKRLRSLGTIMSALKLARDLLVVRPEQFDAGETRWYLNVANGVVDLRTGELGEHRRELLFTRVTEVRYVPGARSEDWDKALRAVPEDVQEWFQRRVGQAATGFPPPDDVVPFWYGGGENGKSTVLTGIKGALGPFYTVVPDKVLTGGTGDHPTEFMTLKGARLAVIEELPGGDWLEDTRLKKVVGSDSGMTARWIGQNNVTWDPTHSLMVTTNHEVRVSDMTHGTWRRLARLRFPYTFEGEDKDEMLRVRLADGGGEDGVWEAVLAWIVEGAVRTYGGDGSGVLVRERMPERVQRDTRAWRLDGDPVSGFFAEGLIAMTPERVAIVAMDVYRRYEEWVRERGHKVLSEKMFWARFEQVKEIVGLGETEKSRVRTSTWVVDGAGSTDREHALCHAKWVSHGL